MATITATIGDIFLFDVRELLRRLAKVSWAGVIGFFASLDDVYVALIVLMAIDYTLSVLYSFANGPLEREKQVRLLVTKVSELLLVVAAGFVSQAMTLPLNLASAVAMAMCFLEFVSIMERCASAGIPVPVKLMEALRNLVELMGGNGRNSQNGRDRGSRP